VQGIEARVTAEDGIQVGRVRASSPTPADVDLEFPLDGNGLDVERLRDLARRLLIRNQQLEQALTSRVVIEQAKGVLAERLSIDPEEAFEILRRAARNHRIKIHAVAARVVEERETPPEIAEVLQ
jgi:hypothetical protein